MRALRVQKGGEKEAAGVISAEKGSDEKDEKIEQLMASVELLAKEVERLKKKKV